MDRYTYRGKDIDTGEWRYGDLYRIPAPPQCIGEPAPPKCYIVFENPATLADWGMPRQMVQADIDPATVGQCTGLKDKNGKMIFEGDIVSFDFIDYERSEKTTESVRWSEQEASFVPWNWEYQCDGCDCHNSIENIEVIGNIHDNADPKEV